MKALTWSGQRDVRVDNVEDPATHKMPLEEAPRGYDIFQKKQDDSIKIVLQP